MWQWIMICVSRWFYQKKKKRLCQVCLGASAPHESSLHLPVGPLSSRHRQDPRSRAQLWQGKQRGLVHRCVSQPSPQPLLPSACFPSHPDCILRQQSPTFWHQRLSSWKIVFRQMGKAMGEEKGGWFGDDSRAFHFLCTLFLWLSHQLQLRPSGIRSRRRGPLLLQMGWCNQGLPLSCRTSQNWFYVTFLSPPKCWCQVCSLCLRHLHRKCTQKLLVLRGEINQC